MAKTKFKLNKIQFFNEGYEELLTSEGVRQEIESQTKRILSNAQSLVPAENDYDFRAWTAMHSYGSGPGKRWLGFVSTTNQRGLKEETEDKVLSRAVST